MDAPQVLDDLLTTLWTQYKQRVSYAARYEEMVRTQGGKAYNDHIAFRTLNTDIGAQPRGVPGIARIFTALGYRQMDMYLFKDKHLTAWHYEHAKNPDYPKLFISQLEVDRLSAPVAQMIRESVKGAPDLLPPTGASGQKLADFFRRPWAPPKRAVVEAVNKESQYGAWTLLHGNAVNHFTAYINKQNVKAWPDLEATVNALRVAGFPMKKEFEGERGSKLRQSSTEAVDYACDVVEDDGKPGKMDWSYAYYELAERNLVPGPDGKPVLFQGFLGAQATNLFEMTKRG
jgi:hypothetical protein